MNYGACLALYTKDGSRLPCRQYMCSEYKIPRYYFSSDVTYTFSAVVAKEKCQDKEYAQVCGSNEETYPTLCHLHQAGQKLAYTGPCRPSLCSETVCGSNGVTYPSPCHARAHNVRIDYYGTCFAEK